MAILYGAPGATLEVLLDDSAEHDFACAAHVLDGLTGDIATYRPLGLSFSIAEIVAHLLENARYNLQLIGHPDPTQCQPPSSDWPIVRAENWDTLRQDYLNVLVELKQVAHTPALLEQVVFPATDDEPGWTVGYKLTCSVAKHAAYHMGQIILLRRLLGVWRD